MSSIDDLSLISGISNISRISRANSSTQHRLDTTNISEWRSMCRDINADSQKVEAKKASESTKFNKALGSYEESMCEYAKLKLIQECLEEIVYHDKNSPISRDTIKKLKEVITIQRGRKYAHLPNYSKDLKEELTLLGIADLKKREFSYEEQLAIKSCIETKLREKIHNFVALYESLAGSKKEALKNNESILHTRYQKKGELENVHWKDKIDEVCLEYRRDLLLFHKMFSQWEELKNKMYEKNTKDAENMLLQAQIAELKVIITKLTCNIRMYKETPVTVNAFKILNSTLDERIASLNEEIAQKTELKKAYDVLNNTEYDEILRKYLELCHVVKKKRNLLDKM